MGGLEAVRLLVLPRVPPFPRARRRAFFARPQARLPRVHAPAGAFPRLEPPADTFPLAIMSAGGEMGRSGRPAAAPKLSGGASRRRGYGGRVAGGRGRLAAAKYNIRIESRGGSPRPPTFF